MKSLILILSIFAGVELWASVDESKVDLTGASVCESCLEASESKPRASLRAIEKSYGPVLGQIHGLYISQSALQNQTRSESPYKGQPTTNEPKPVLASDDPIYEKAMKEADLIARRCTQDQVMGFSESYNKLHFDPKEPMKDWAYEECQRKLRRHFQAALGDRIESITDILEPTLAQLKPLKKKSDSATIDVSKGASNQAGSFFQKPATHIRLRGGGKIVVELGRAKFSKDSVTRADVLVKNGTEARLRHEITLNGNENTPSSLSFQISRVRHSSDDLPYNDRRFKNETTASVYYNIRFY